MSFLSWLLLCLLAAAVSVVPVSGWSTGSGTCRAAADSITSQTGRHPIAPTLGFYLDFPTQYSSGQSITITIRNANKNPNITYFNGFLVYATDSKGNRVGTFTASTGNIATTNMKNAIEAVMDPNTGIYSCVTPGSTATHGDGGQKSNGATLTWTAPTTDTGTITFSGLVEYSNVMFYTQVLTNWTICPSTGSPCPTFNPNNLPVGPLPPPPAGTVSPLGLAPIDQTACGSFVPVPYAAVPPGFCASVYATVSRPRGIYVTDQGDLLVVETGSNSGVSVLRDLNGDGVINPATEYTRILTINGLNHALYMKNGYMYVSTPSTVYRAKYNTSTPTVPATEQITLVKNIPNNHHVSRTTLVSHDGQWMYLTVGSGSNVDPDDSRARVVRYNLNLPVPSGGWQWNNYSTNGVQAFAPGMRNEVGLILDLTGVVWGVMNADDDLNRPDLGGYDIHNNNPAERLDRLLESQMTGWYGYPQCWVVDILAGHQTGEIFSWCGDGSCFYNDSIHTDDWCRKNMIPPAYPLQAHTAPLGLVFYSGKGKYAFPPEYYNQIFIAQHGSWDSNVPRGYKVTSVATDQKGDVVPLSARDFFAYQGPGAISGNWPHKMVDPKIGPNGELFVSSDASNAIIVIRYLNPNVRPVLASQLAVSGYTGASVGGPSLPVSDFSFDRMSSNKSNANFRWVAGSGAHTGLASFDGVHQYINASAADNGAGTVTPNITGGYLTLETWIYPTGFANSNSANVIFEVNAPSATDSSGRSDDFVCLYTLASSSTSATVYFWTFGGGGKVERLLTYGPIMINQWTHIAGSIIPALGNQVNFTLYVNGAQVLQQMGSPSDIPAVMNRTSAFIGRSFRSVVGPFNSSNYQGWIDDLRLYSYGLSPAQVALNYQFSVNGPVNPIVWSDFTIEPMESVEPKYQHMGAANHHNPAPANSDLFPGFVRVNGNSINLTNQMNGIGSYIGPNTLMTVGDTFSLELWLRPAALTGTVVYVNPQLSVSLSGQGVQFSVPATGPSTMVPASLPLNSWTHVVWTIFNSGANAAHVVFFNGTFNSTTMFKTSSIRFNASSVMYAALGTGLSGQFAGDLAVFRLYSVQLSADQVSALYAAFTAPVTVNPYPMPSVPSQSPSPSSLKDDGNNTGLIAGVVVASIVCLLLVVGVYVWRRHPQMFDSLRPPTDGLHSHAEVLLSRQ